jgi:NADH:ubiquinone oxidoreductase subunit 5 (subunit L)/multisubunit Na+/H+ antiporter MnhA subunit
MKILLENLILLPLLGFLISVLIKEENENLLSRFVFFIMLTCGLIDLIVTGGLIYNNFISIEDEFLTIYESDKYHFVIDFIFNETTAIFLLIGTFLVYLVTIYCKYYLHKEKGFKRFFTAIVFFYLGYNIVVLSGNMFTLFIGWEILGVSSFFLIAYYRNRYLPVKNAVKVFSIYRLGDIAIILALWMNHHLWERNITFNDFINQEYVLQIINKHPLEAIFVSLMILLAAVAKSAQFPFSSWLPRAMEGPTPSSAIFYGSLSVNLGVLLLIKTYLFWSNILLIKILVLIVGLITSIMASSIARVQSSIKGQIAYASIAQIGLIFIEIALGFKYIALIHFTGNAFLRTYQLLISPSVVSYLIKEQIFNSVPRSQAMDGFLPYKLEKTIYTLSLKEWNLGKYLNHFYWHPLKWLGDRFKFITPKTLGIIFISSLIYSFLMFNFFSPIPYAYWHAMVYAFFGLVFLLISFTERNLVRLSWAYIVAGNLIISIAVSFNAGFNLNNILIYNSGVLLSGIVGYIVLNQLRHKEHGLNLDHFNGHAYEHPNMTIIFFISGLMMFGFPISPTFIGLDIYFGEIKTHQVLLLFCIALSYVVCGLSVIRLYTRVFLGPHIKTYHETAYRSS